MFVPGSKWYPHAYSVISVRLMTRPAWRIRYSRTANSLGVSSRGSPARLAVGNEHHSPALLLEPALDETADGRIIFDHENFHALRFTASSWCHAMDPPSAPVAWSLAPGATRRDPANVSGQPPSQRRP